MVVLPRVRCLAAWLPGRLRGVVTASVDWVLVGGERAHEPSALSQSAGSFSLPVGLCLAKHAHPHHDTVG